MAVQGQIFAPKDLGDVVVAAIKIDAHAQMGKTWIENIGAVTRAVHQATVGAFDRDIKGDIFTDLAFASGSVKALIGILSFGRNMGKILVFAHVFAVLPGNLFEQLIFL